MPQEPALQAKYNTQQAVDGIYRTLIITSADISTGQLQGTYGGSSSDPIDIALNQGPIANGIFQYTSYGSPDSNISFSRGVLSFQLKSDDRTFNRLYGTVTKNGTSIGNVTFAKIHT
ncbi:hypothetical protein [Pseudomonas frederiksbergensis]|uniref:hypothetical protein n=1 Tax=Pseudomonas frederiksbergensis TaxID=104087 RepID=UPI0011CD41C5|nr:hypothetical protein [Pseudomonas frederiksbergensis]